MTFDEKIMKDCIRLAAKGKGKVSPNPLVGCIIIKNNKLIGKGYHKKFGEAHAETNAVIDAEKHGYNVKGASVYVNLEPCAHVNKTPSCADFLVSKKVKEVFIGMKDPYTKVNGKGIDILLEAGVKIKEGILKKDCEELNRFFIKFVNKRLPYVTLKIAQSIDGKIALDNFESKYITGKVSRKYVHNLRNEYDAVLIGKNTALKDNPSLTVREVRGRDPLRIVIDRKNSLPDQLEIFSKNMNNKTFVITGKSSKLKMLKGSINKNLLFMKNDEKEFKIRDILKLLYGFNVNSILVEGGSKLFSQFIKEGFYDEVLFLIAPKIVGKGLSAFDSIKTDSLKDSIDLEFEKSLNLDKDILLKYKNVHRYNSGNR